MEALYRGDGPLDPQWSNPVPGGMDEPGGACLLGEADGAPVCVGGLRDLGDGACEIKRMYVVPEARRQGLARQLLAALEDRARVLGYTRARLDTGRHQPHAQRMYEESGYNPDPPTTTGTSGRRSGARRRSSAPVATRPARLA